MTALGYFEEMAKRSLRAISAAQRLAREKRVQLSEASEEILASLLGAVICTDDGDRRALLAKAVAELLERGQSPENASRQIQQLRELLGALL